MKSIKGNLLDLAENGYFDVIVQGCNVYNTFGAGLAKEIKNRYPQAYQADLKTIRGDKNKLGKFSYSVERSIKDFDHNFFIINAYTQFNYGRDKNIVYVKYDAVEKCFSLIKNAFNKYRVGIPKIGAGLANGDWDRIQKIIESFEFNDITLVIK